MHRHENRLVIRSDDSVERLKMVKVLSGRSSSNSFHRSGNGEAFFLPDEQLQSRRVVHSSSLQAPLADRTILQMDQAAPSDKALFRQHAQRGEDADMDRDLRLRAGGDNQERAQAGALFIRNSPNPERFAI